MKYLYALVTLSLWVNQGQSQTLTDSLVVLYGFDGNVTDGSGRNNNGTASNLTYGSDRMGNSNRAAVFNGSNASVTIPSNDLFNSEYTYSLWFYLQTDMADGTKAILLTVGGTSCDQSINLTNNYFTYTGINTGGYHSSGTYNINYNSLPATQTWHHLIQVKSADSLKMYLDGQKLSIAANQTPCYTGSSPQGRVGAGIGNSQFFNGKIDQLRIYKRAITDTEALSIYNNELTSVKKLDPATIQLYPNPAEITVSFNSSISVESVKVMELTGKQVAHFGFNNELNGHIDISGLKPAYYFLEIFTTSGSVIERLIIE